MLRVSRAESVGQLSGLVDDVSVLVNNAGRMAGTTSVLKSSVDDVAATFDTNVLGPIRAVQELAPMLGRHEHSAVVNVHSVLPWLAGTGPSKAALWSISNSARLELKSQGTAVIGVHLSFADTNMTANLRGVSKVTPAFVATSVIDGLERGDAEILVDLDSQNAK